MHTASSALLNVFRPAFAGPPIASPSQAADLDPLDDDASPVDWSEEDVVFLHWRLPGSDARSRRQRLVAVPEKLQDFLVCTAHRLVLQERFRAECTQLAHARQVLLEPPRVLKSEVDAGAPPGLPGRQDKKHVSAAGQHEPFLDHHALQRFFE